MFFDFRPSFSVDIILESGKKSCTILPHFSKSMEVYLSQSNYAYVSTEIAIIGFDEIEIAELNTDNTDTTIDIPLLLAFRKNDNLIIGFGSSKIPDTRLIAYSNTTDTLLALGIGNTADDPLNEKYTFVVFANEYKDPSGNDLVIFYEGEDFGADTANANASGGNVYRTTVGTDMLWSHTALKKGTYVAVFRGLNVASSAAFVNYQIKKDGAVIEDHGFNIAGATNFTFPTSFTTLFLTFTVDDETATYDIYVKNATEPTETDVDLVCLIPLTNGKDFTMDLFEQGLSISNNKYIGHL